MSSWAHSRHSLAGTTFRVARTTSTQRSGLASLKDSSVRRCLIAGICSSNWPSLPSCDQMFRAVNSPSAARRAGGLAEFVADENAFQRDRRLRALVGVDFDVEGGDDLGGGGLLVVEVGSVFEDFAGDDDAGLEALGGAELGQQTVLQG